MILAKNKPLGFTFLKKFIIYNAIDFSYAIRFFQMLYL